MAIRWWLELDTSDRSTCPYCPDTALDPLGHHAMTCRHGGDVIISHNRLWNEVINLCRRAHLSVSVEKGHGLTRDLDHTRPADILIAGWDSGKPAALDIISHHPSALPSWVSCVTTLVQQPLQKRPVSSTPMDPNDGLVLHSIGSGEIWQLGQGGPRYHLQAGIPPRHSPVLPKSSVVAEIYGG